MKCFEKIYKVPSVAGYEKQMKEVIIKEIENYCEEIFEDNFGNLIATVGSGDEVVAVNTCISEDGLFVTSASEGKIKVSPIGNIKAGEILGGRYTDGENNGIVYLKDKKIEDADTFDLSLDFFGKNPECGTILSPVGNLMNNGDFCTGKSVSVKMRIAILVSIIKTIKPQNTTYKFIFSVEDNLGFKGAKVAFKNEEADRGYIIGSASDDNKITGITMGKGPCVRLKDKVTVFNGTVIKTLTEKINLKEYQKEISDTMNVTANRAMWLGNGTPLININIPVGYINTFNETVNITDVEKIVRAFTE